MGGKELNIGIPRALSYFDYFPMWQTFFNHLGFKITISSPTTKDILNKGVSLCVDDACLPVKIFHGHVADLVGKVDAIFVPRLISVSPGEFICPKFIGLPEMIKNSIKNLPPLLIFNYNLHKDTEDKKNAFYDLGRQLGLSSRSIEKAYKEAISRQYIYEVMLESGQNPLAILHPKEKWDKLDSCKGVIGIIAHSYLVCDRYISMDIVRKIRNKGYDVRVVGNVSQKKIEDNLKAMPKRLFWSYGKKLLGSGMEWLKGNEVDGIIFLSSFACGIDSFIEELIQRFNARKLKLPYTVFTVDEHSGQAGFDTRLEAFLDMLEWRDKSGYNFSSHGQDVYSGKSSF